MPGLRFDGKDRRQMDEEILGRDAANRLHDPQTHVIDRVGLSRDAWANFDAAQGVDKSGTLGALISQVGSLPAWMVEDRERRARWHFLFEGHPQKGGLYRDGKNCAVRRCTEVALDNSIRWLIGEYLPRISFPFGHKLESMNPEQFIRYFTRGQGPAHEAATITQYPAQVLGLVRQIVPALVTRLIFSYFTVSTPSARIPVLNFSYGQDHDPWADDGDDLFVMTAGEHDQYYSGGAYTNFPIGTGDGVAVNFDLPTSEILAGSLVVYVNGVATAVTLGAGTGTGGRDRVTFGVAPAAAAVITASFSVSPAKGEAGRQVDASIAMVTLSDEVLPLTVEWDIVDEQDAMAFHGIALNAEFVRATMQKIGLDLDAATLLDALNNATAGNATWDTAGYLAGDTNSEAVFAYDNTLNEMFVEASEFIYTRHGRRPTWAVVGADISRRLQNLKQFRAWPEFMGNQTMLRPESTGLQTPIGIVDGQWMIYQAPGRMPATRALFGFTPVGPFDVTYAVGIYNPFFTTGEVVDGNARLKKRQTNAMRVGKAVVKPTQLATGELI